MEIARARLNLNATWPLVLITSPADQRLATHLHAADSLLGAGFEIRLVVEALTVNGGCVRDQITVSNRPPPYCDAAPGSAAHAVGIWPEHGLLGTQLGPNKNGHGW